MNGSATIIRRLILVLAAWCCFDVSACADVVFFKDGYIIEGTLVREGKTVLDGEPVWLPTGFFYLNDYGRVIYFCPAQVQEYEQKKYEPAWQLKINSGFSGVQAAFPIQKVTVERDWDSDGKRKITLSYGLGDKQKTTSIEHKILTLSSTVVRTQTAFVGTNAVNWWAFYLLRELDPRTVKSILESNPELTLSPVKKKPSDPDLTEDQRLERRWKLFRMLAQTEWLDLAERELDALLKEFPKQKEEVEKNRAIILQQRSQLQLEHIRHALTAEQFARANELIKAFPEDKADEKIKAEYRVIRKRFEDAIDKFTRVQRTYNTLLDGIKDEKTRPFFKEWIERITAELTLSEFMGTTTREKQLVGRLENFMILGGPLADQLKKGGRVEPVLINEALSLAVTGWLLGNASAEKRVETAMKLSQAREFVLSFLNTEDRRMREQMLADYAKESSGTVSPEEFAYLIQSIGPLQPGTAKPRKTEEVVIGARGRHSYLLRLPAEYSHHSPFGYPVLVVLHDQGEQPLDALNRWADFADERGYILVAPRWGKAGYNYTNQEHDAVLLALKDLRNSYRVDSDRVFLFGLGEGGTMTYDVGFSHPDLFAGIVPMSANPEYYPLFYHGNAQYLPIYAVCGDGCKQRDTNRQLFEDLIPRGYPAMLIKYRGRGAEWFGGEVPNIFEWMSRKTRVNPQQELGKLGGSNRGFATMRSTDDQFYWLKVEEIASGCLQNGVPFAGKATPAKIQATVAEKNTIRIESYGVKQMTMWFARNGLIDFEKPVKVTFNGVSETRKVTPSLDALLTDFAARQDRQRLHLAKWEFRSAK